MADRSRDWMAQAEDNLESAVLLRQGGKHGSACFMAQQAAENAVKAAHMPVRSFNSPFLKWPERAEVVAGLRAWAERQRATHPELARVGYFGSLTDGVRYGIGSDADVVAVVTHSSREHWYQRPLDFDPPSEVPVNVDLRLHGRRIYTDPRPRRRLRARDAERRLALTGILNT